MTDLEQFYYGQFVAYVSGKEMIMMGAFVIAMLVLLLTYITIKDHSLHFGVWEDKPNALQQDNRSQQLKR